MIKNNNCNTNQTPKCKSNMDAVQIMADQGKIDNTFSNIQTTLNSLKSALSDYCTEEGTNLDAISTKLSTIIDLNLACCEDINDKLEQLYDAIVAIPQYVESTSTSEEITTTVEQTTTSLQPTTTAEPTTSTEEQSTTTLESTTTIEGTTTTCIILLDLDCIFSSNDANYLTTPTYDGSGEVMHPDIYYNAAGWNGYKYWMAMTPYPATNDAYENPSVIASNDGDTWVEPGAISNPLYAFPGGSGHNADPDIFMGLDSKLWIVFVEKAADGVTRNLRVMSSSNGINWSATTVIATNSGSKWLSPAVVVEDSAYVMYFVDISAGTGSNAVLKKWTASTPDGTWSNETSCAVTGLSVGRYIWHLDILKYNTEYHMLLNTSDGSNLDQKLNFAASCDGINFEAKSSPIIEQSASGWDDDWVYRGTMVLMSDGDHDYYDIWYSAKSSSNVWHVGRTTSSYLDCYTTTAEPTTTVEPTTTSEELTTTAEVDLCSSLISVWKLDETSGATAYDSYGSNDLVNSNATINQTGKIDKAYSFNSSTSEVYLNSVSTILPTDNFTITAWIKRTGTSSSTSKLGTIMGKYHGSGARCYIFGLYDSDNATYPNNLRLMYYDSTNTQINVRYNPGSDIWTDNWMHVVGIKNGDKLSLYVNGEWEADFTGGNGTMNVAGGSSRDTIGAVTASAVSPDFVFNGLIDEVYIYDKVLTSDEITYMYNSGNGISFSSLGCPTTTVEPTTTIEHTTTIEKSTTTEEVTTTIESTTTDEITTTEQVTTTVEITTTEQQTTTLEVTTTEEVTTTSGG